MPFPDSFLQELKLRSDITEIASSYVNLKRHGRNMVGLCPFHGEKTPSFNIYTGTGNPSKVQGFAGYYRHLGY